MGLRRHNESIHEDRVYLGRITKPHALSGEVKFQPFGCDPRLLETLGRVRVEKPDRLLEVEYVRGSQETPIVKFKQVDDRNASENISGFVLWVEEKELPKLDAEDYYESDLLYSRVLTVAGEDLGQLEAIMETGACDVLVVRNSGGEERLLPACREVVKAIRKQEKVIIVDPLPEAHEKDDDSKLHPADSR